jgi:dephospho-CoA kinase
VFSDPQKLAHLESIIHPPVLDLWRDRVTAISLSDPRAVILSDVPLLIEDGLQHLFDIVMLVYIPPGEQMNRLIKRNGYTRDHAEKRIASQMPIDDKIKYAQILFHNDGTLEETKEKLEILWQELKKHEAMGNFLNIKISL